MKRVYVHLEDVVRADGPAARGQQQEEGGAALTEAIDIGPAAPSCSPRALIDEVMRRRSGRLSSSGGAAADDVIGFRLRFEAARGRDDDDEGEVELRSPRDWDKAIFDLVDNKADIFLSLRLGPRVVSVPPPPPSPPAAATAAAAAPPVPVGTRSPSRAGARKAFDVGLAEQLLKNRKLRRLREMCEEAAPAPAPGGSRDSPEMSVPLMFLWKLRMENELCDEAARVSLRMCSLRPGDWVVWAARGAALSLCSLQRQQQHGGPGLGDEVEERDEEALECYQKAGAPINKGSADASSSALAGIAGLIRLDPALGEAASLFRLHRHAEAADVLNEVIARGDEAEAHVPVLTLYASICLVYKKWSECIRSLLKAVITPCPSRKAVKEAKCLLVQAMASPAGMEELQRQLVPSAATAPALAFLGVTAKDEGHFQLALQLMGLAAMQAPSNSNYALAICHVHEAMGQVMEAFKHVRDFFALNRKLCIDVYPPGENGGGASYVGMMCGDFADLLDRYVLGPPAPRREGTDARKRYFLHWERELDTVPAAVVSGAAEYSMHPGTGYDGFASVVSLGEDGAVATLDYNEGGDASIDTGKYEGVTLASGDASLDILALMFTAVKLLFTSGKLECIPHFVRLIEPSRVALQKQARTAIHQTHIRNEHAYYLCVVQIVAAHSDMYLAAVEARRATGEGGSSSSLMSGLRCWLRDRDGGSAGDTGVGEDGERRDVVYVCGDSHSLSSAWWEFTTEPGTAAAGGDGVTTDTAAGDGSTARPRRTITLVPKLVTGLKHWHLREESHFYPKEIFNRTCASIPDGSTVVFLVGEIDCREGMLRAVERDQHGASLETAARTSCEVFARALRALLARKPRLKVSLLTHSEPAIRIYMYMYAYCIYYICVHMYICRSSSTP
jgi:tetratricopeptide (TPR) repeat protein